MSYRRTFLLFCSLAYPHHLLLSHFSRVRLCDPIDVSPPGSPIPGILQARTLEWVATSFSNAWKWKVKVKSLSCVLLLVTPWTAAYQASPSMGFSKQEYWSGLPVPSPIATSIGCYYYLVLLQGVSLSFEHSTLTKKIEKQKKISGLVTGDKSNANSDFTQTCQLI